MLNRVIEVGRITKSPEIKYTPNGKAYCRFTIAVNRQFTNQNGERQADFIPCICWGKTAENTANYCDKGSLIGIDGRLESRSYDDQNNQKRFVLEVICESVRFLETKSQATNRQANQQTPIDTNKYGYAAGYNENPFAPKNQFDSAIDTFDIMDDDIQF